MNSSDKNLVVWQRAMELVLEVYRCTKTFPREETYGLVAQIRRAAVSMPSNIAEGKGRYAHKELTSFLLNARGSLLGVGNTSDDRREARLSGQRGCNRAGKAISRSWLIVERADLALQGSNRPKA